MITNLRMQLFEALVQVRGARQPQPAPAHAAPRRQAHHRRVQPQARDRGGAEDQEQHPDRHRQGHRCPGGGPSSPNPGPWSQDRPPEGSEEGVTSSCRDREHYTTGAQCRQSPGAGLQDDAQPQLGDCWTSWRGGEEARSRSAGRWRWWLPVWLLPPPVSRLPDQLWCPPCPWPAALSSPTQQPTLAQPGDHTAKHMTMCLKNAK